MILLAVNGGMGQTDVAALPKSAFDRGSSWLTFPRPKTGIDRRIPLWPETLATLREAIDARSEATSPDDDRLCFLTRQGNGRVRNGDGDKHAWKDAVGLEFGKLLRKLDLKRPGLQFDALRHTFQTIGGDAKDPDAVSSIMGHANAGMAAAYRERISDDRLGAVVETVPLWLWPTERRGRKPRGKRNHGRRGARVAPEHRPLRANS
jgi:integrase